MIVTGIFAALIGLCFGSFANVVIWRTPRGETVLKPARSYCPSCGETLDGLLLVPVMSWMALKGRCFFCKERIPIRYPIVEALTGALFVVTALTKPSWIWAFGGLFVFFMVCMAYIDADTQLISNGLLIFGAFCALLYRVTEFVLFRDVWMLLDALLGAAAGALPLFLIDILVLKIRKMDAFGGGDVKLMAVCGLFLGWKMTSLALMLSFIIGGVFAAVLLISKRAQKGSYIAFAPFLAGGVLLSFFWGEPILKWYLRIIAGA